MKHYLITLAAVLCLMATAWGGETAGSATYHLKLDTSTGVRPAVLGVPETLTFTTNYPGGAVAGATVEITVNGAELVTTNGTGTVEWTPTRSGTNELHHIVKAGETVIANLVARFLLPTVEVTPTNLPHVTSHVYTNGVEVALSGEPPAYSVVSNQENTVIIYTTDDYYVFPGGDTAYTNRVDTGKDPTGLMPGETPPPVPQHEARAVRYLAPVYVGGDAKGGVASWTTNEVAVGAYDVVESSPSAVTWGAPGGESWYVVAGLDIRIGGGVTCQGAVNLILRPGARLTVAHVADGKAGIATGAAGSFAAYGQPEGEGELTVTGGAGGAAIGGGKGEDGSRITINGGVIHALAHGLGPTTNDLCGSVGIGGVTCSNVLFRGGCTLAEGWPEEGLGIGGTSSATGIVASVDRMVQVGEGSWPDEIVAHGEGEDLAPKLAAKRVALVCDGEVTTIGTAPDEVEHTTTTVYTNGVASADGTAWLNGDATVTYVCDEGWVFADGTSEKTYRLDTRYDPATIINGEHPPEVVPGVGLTGVAARTRYPWNGLVDIDYTLRSNLPAGYTLTVMAFGGIETCEATAVAFAPDATAAGAHTLTWDMNADGFCDVEKGVVFRVTAKKAPGAAGVSVMDSSDPVALDLRTGKVRQVAFGETETLTFTPDYMGAPQHEAVQLWENGPYIATCNVGAPQPQDYGYYFWWGDTVGYTNTCGQPKTSVYDGKWLSTVDGTEFLFKDSNCQTYKKDTEWLRDNGWITIDGSVTNLVAEHDAATVHWGSPWRMMTYDELGKLADTSYCRRSWSNDWNGTGVKGFVLTGATTGYADKSIFLPAAGYGNGDYLNAPGSYGYYWSAAPRSGNDNVMAWHIYFYNSNFVRFYSNYRCYGFPVRAVRADASERIRGAKVTVTVTDPTGAVTTLVTTNGTGAIEWTPTVLGTNTLEHTVYAADGVTVVTNFVARFYCDYMVEVRPHPQDHTTADVYVGGEPVLQTAGNYSVVSNETVDVVFRADAGYHFEGKANAKTNTIEATKSVNEVAGPAVAFVTLDLNDPSNATHTITFDYAWVTKATGKADIPAQEAALNVLQANGQMKWQNLILGLDGTQATARPVCEVVATSDEENVTFRLGGVNVATDSGATVTYKAWLGSVPGGRDLGESEEKAYDELLPQPLPPAKGVSVLYYLLEAFIR